MPFIENFKGKTGPAIALLFYSGHTVGTRGGETSFKREFWVHNERMTKFTITGIAGNRIFTWDRDATGSNPYFNQSLNTYTLPPVDVDEINAMMDAPHPQWKIDIEFSYEPFFDWLLYYMVNNDQTKLNNFAHPENTNVILDTLIYQPPQNDNVLRVDYKTNTIRYTNIPMDLRDASCSSGPIPAVKLTFIMLLHQNPDPVKMEIMRRLVAMDWTELKKAGRGYKNWSQMVMMPNHPDDWYHNVFYFIINHTNVDRGELFRQRIIDRCRPWTDQQPNHDQALVATVRNEVDTYMIASNHWDQQREHWNTEQYQKVCSDVFGTILQTVEVAAPLKILRDIIESFNYDRLDDASILERVRFYLQYGFGNCGEHAKIVLSVLDSLRTQNPNSLIHHIVLAAFANIDHQFTIMNLDVTDVIPTNTHGDNPYLKNDHETEIQVFDLRQADTANTAAHHTGYIIDAYLDPSVQPVITTTTNLLQTLQSPTRTQQQKNTDYLRFFKEIPESITLRTKIDTLPNI